MQPCSSRNFSRYFVASFTLSMRFKRISTMRSKFSSSGFSEYASSKYFSAVTVSFCIMQIVPSMSKFWAFGSFVASSCISSFASFSLERLTKFATLILIKSLSSFKLFSPSAMRLSKFSFFVAKASLIASFR